LDLEEIIEETRVGKSQDYLVSFAAVFWDVTQRSPQRSPLWGERCVTSQKTAAKETKDYRDVIVFKKLRFQNVFRPYKNENPAFSNSSGLKSVFNMLRFRDGFVWKEGLTLEINARDLNRV